VARAHPGVDTALKTNVPLGAGLLVAVSGGIDSVVLLHGLSGLARLKRLRLEVAHVDHKVRRESSLDAAFVEKLAKKLKAPFHRLNLNKCPKGENFEAWARAQRYAYFAQVAAQRKLNFVVTAHHANDLAETFLMRLLANRRPSLPLARDAERLLLRPLLDVTRAQIAAYAKTHGLKFRQDRTNFDQERTRNKVRLRLIPYLERNFDPHIIEVLAAQARRIVSDSLTLDVLVLKIAQKIETESFGSKKWLSLLRLELGACGAVLGQRLVQRLLLKKLGFELGSMHAGRVLKFLSGRGRAMDLPSGWTLKRRSGGLLLERKPRHKPL
jgi:tRNA(Ile)-lysidine synthase